MPTLKPERGGANVLNYDVADDLKFYHKGIKPLEDSHKYDVSPGKLDNIKQRVRMFGWTEVITIPSIVQAPAVAVTHNLINSYGLVTIAKCMAKSQGYMVGVTRDGQNSVMLFNFLFRSLTVKGLNKVTVNPDQYTINGEQDGLCFLQTIISKVQLDTLGTVDALRKFLTDLGVKMVELAGNAIDFNRHVNSITNALDSYGEIYPELMTHLFKAYKLIEDLEFTTYILVTKYGYAADPTAHNPRTLMHGVENQYKMRVQAGTWKTSIASKVNNEILRLFRQKSQRTRRRHPPHQLPGS
jgi:hypothetical protein